ncbi:methyltransferase family protein [Aspergillus fischeri NRRL 181]|uniref:Prenyl cysteine carboxyl methyltransferase, putative n=1 Tax=Neosartorya fischeri (strain ATCC 1020 / DSM 3700 / CBS 544.65 / FGSC A1164 / JCM 1740 / NRRL 181 / WB 181) TaxID=331117 RepID=A1DHZ1_NEOFI|nr:prenyl cysteine carboxyl methyltransferase, putative [Aspergillus fischeri NRRL 181]EAW18998.1 prenyl cysteine carboxyl methyltransferase, putative [Aspergillus fischeri NRRL 181]
MISLSAVTLSLSILLAGYLSAICVIPPTTTQRSLYETDRIRIITGNFAISASRALIIIGAYHALVTLFYTPDTNSNILPAICPHPENLTPKNLTWTPAVLLSLLTIASGAAIRLSAFGSLGRNFTFYLSVPDRLVTDGVYAYVQHPSYTALVVVCLGCAGLSWRWDGAVGACLLRKDVIERLDGLGMMVIGALWMVGMMLVRVRVRDEERILREKFGREWERWNARTARYIPGIL